jgi:Polyketide cyclase / dehydrase and lipid transport
MSSLKKVLLVLLLGIGGLLAFAATRPDTYRVERSRRIEAPIDVVYRQVDNFKSWGAWSPWDKRDPAMTKTFSGPDNGVGAVYAWVGNDKVGQGKMTIIDAKPPRDAAIGDLAVVSCRLEFIKPFASVATASFVIGRESDSATAVSWSMEGRSNFMAKVFGVFMNMDKMIGGDFEAGLANLKAVAEAEAARKPPAPAQAVAAP